MRSLLRSCASCLCLTVLLGTAPALGAPDLADKFSIGAGAGTDHKPQSKLWFNDGAWWAVMYDGSRQRIWKFENGNFLPQTYPDAAVDDRATSRADVLWDGTSLCVMMWHDALPKFSKYSYDSSTQTYRRLPGFPVDLPIAGAECIVIDKDSTGRLWGSYELNLQVHVIWTTTPDHLTWNLTGTVLEGNLDADDITATLAFGGNQIGVFWSDQGSEAPWQFGFRVHRDSDPPESWQPLEVVDTGSAVDDHMHATADADGRVYVTTKDLYNHIQLYVRAPAGGWTTAASNINNGVCTRPIVMLDDDSDMVRVFYTDWLVTPNPILMASAPRSTLVFGAPEVWLTPSGLSLNDVTGTKQHLSAKSGIMAMASSSSSAYWGFRNLDQDSPSTSAVYPASDQVGIVLQPLVQVHVLDAGMGVRRSSISMTFDGVPVMPSIAGNASDYLLGWTPPAALENGRIYSFTISAQDYAWPPHSTTTTRRFRTEMLPSPVEHKINFQPLTGATPAGYEIDSGKLYSLDLGTGWNKSLTAKRAGVNADPRYDTWVERKNSSTKATWSYDVPNGTYRVTFAAGCPNAAGKQRVEVEGVVLLNNQSTSAGQFLTVSEYAVGVLDGQLNVKIGGAGGSTNTQLCFFEFRYDGPPPPPPPPSSGNDPAPRAVAGLQALRSGSDVLLTWSPVTEDTTGEVIAIARYHVYRGSTPGFLPDLAAHSNRVGMVASTTYTDVGAMSAAGDLYYLVSAERLSGVESRHASNLGVRRRVALSPAPGAQQRAWLALPYSNAYVNAQGLAASMNGAPSGPVVSLARVDRSTQERHTWSLQNGTWGGTNFTLIPGDAVEVTANGPWNWTVVGAESSTPAFGFGFRTDRGNLTWIALPPNATYADARSLITALNGGTSAGPVTKLAWLNPQTMQMESWLWFAGAWRGVNFPVQPGTGLAVLVSGDLPSWSPHLAQP